MSTARPSRSRTSSPHMQPPFSVDCRGTAGWCEIETFETQERAERFAADERRDDETKQTVTRWEYRVRDSRVQEGPQESA